ncbi:hypothetical protein BTVI_34108 [Pitangus sulphuratus]|nr:hypothetical protein BTVI_34108 [Pitangus sulphuratus]
MSCPSRVWYSPSDYAACKTCEDNSRKEPKGHVKVVMMQLRKSFEKLHLRHWGLEKLPPQPLRLETNGKFKKSEEDENCGFKKVVWGMGSE